MADFVYEITCTGDHDHEAAVHAWADRDAAPAWVALPELTAVDLYRPLRGGTHDPFNDDGPGPLLIAMLQFSDRKKLEAALAHARFRESLAGKPAAVAATGTAMERRLFATAASPDPGPLRAPFSYVVRYHRPAEDEAAFVAHYVADHPRLEARFPGIRSIMCYFPLAAPVSQRVPCADYMLGNEVVFDCVEDFNTAMQSPVRHEMREHFHSFPKFSGAVTHFAMLRERLAG